MPTFPFAIFDWLNERVDCLAKVGMETGPLAVWLWTAQIRSHEAYVNRATLTAREALVCMRVKLENEIRGLLKTFGVMFGKRVGGFRRRAEKIIGGELAVAPELVPIFRSAHPSLA